MFQSTHPCGVRTIKFTTANSVLVSIHAPVWGANVGNVVMVRGAWFQSTHPCGVRNGLINVYRDESVSIHAPVCGANPPDCKCG